MSDGETNRAIPYAFYLNRKAGGEPTEIERRYAASLRSSGIPVFDRGTPDQAHSFIAGLLTEQVGTLIVSGGDGTLNVVLNALDATAAPETWPQIVLLPGGTTNLLARRLALPRLEPMLAKLKQMDLGTRLPTVTAHSIRLGEQLGVVCGVGYFERASSEFTSGDGLDGDDVGLWAAMGILRTAVGIGRVSWLEKSLQKAPRLPNGEQVLLPNGQIPAGGVLTCEPRISVLWEKDEDTELAGVHSMLSGGDGGRMLRHGVQATLRLRRSSPLIRTAVDDRLFLPAGERVMLDGEYIELTEDTQLQPGPTFEVVHPRLPMKKALRIMPLPIRYRTGRVND